MRFYTIGCAALAALLLAPISASAAETALMQAPARNAALIAKVPGFKAANVDCYHGKRAISEGVLIRKTFIKDGKIVIPPAGLVYSSRIASIGTMTASEVMLLGKQYPHVDERHEYLVVKNATMKKGDSINLLPDGSRALQFVSSSEHPYGSIAPSATLRIMKSTGNFYGTSFTVATHPILTDVNSGEFRGMGLETGRYAVDENTGDPLQQKSYFGNSIYPSGKSYLVVGKVTANEVEVQEFGTPSLTELWLSAAPRISGAYSVGDVVSVGDATVKIDAIGKDSVRLVLTDKAGKAVARDFTNLLDPNAQNFLPSSPAERVKYQMATDDGKVRVQVAMLHPEGVLTADGKVRLDLYKDVFNLKSAQAWPGDARFTVRPDTWASCAELNEIVLENTEEIVLDSTSNVLAGPENYFKVIIDDFDGKKINAWHFEDAEGNKSPNLASFAGGAHIDLVANFENKSIGSYGNRMAEQALKRELAAKGFVMTK